MKQMMNTKNNKRKKLNEHGEKEDYDSKEEAVKSSKEKLTKINEH